MRVLVVAASKGGVGKTTLAACLSVEAMRNHKSVAIMDLDPQGSFSLWHGIRSDDDDLSDLALINPSKDLRRTVMRTKKGKYDYLIVDTPPGSLTRTLAAIEIADLVLIPMRPSPIDAATLDTVLQLCAAHQRPSAIILNEMSLRSAMTKGARDYLKTRGCYVLKDEIPARELYASAMLKGSTPSELKPDGVEAKEIAKLWRSIDEAAVPVTTVKPARKPKST